MVTGRQEEELPLCMGLRKGLQYPVNNWLTSVESKLKASHEEGSPMHWPRSYMCLHFQMMSPRRTEEFFQS